MDRSAQRCRQVHELVVSGDRLLDHPSDSAWLRIQACMAIPAATEALIDRVDPWLRTVAGAVLVSRKPAIRSARPASVQVCAISMASATFSVAAADG